MPRIEGTTDTQSAFLRAFRLHQGGPPPEAWPSPAILRRWLRHDGFQRAFADLQRTLQTMLEFQSLTTGLAATRALHDHLTQETTTPAAAPATPPLDPNLNPEPRTLNPPPTPQHQPQPQANPQPAQEKEQQQDPRHARLALEREKLRHRAMLATLRLAHARLPSPPRAPVAKPQDADPEPRDPCEQLPGETLEQAAIRLAHPNCRPEVAIAFIKGEPHPFYDQPEYDLTTNPPTFISPPNPAAVARAKASHDEAVALIKADYARRGETPPPDLVAPYTPRDPYARNANAANTDAPYR